MKKFYYYQETKCVIWQRNRFAIEAESYEQALKEAEKFKEMDISTSDDSELITDTEFNTESYEMLSPEENEYKATCELYATMVKCWATIRRIVYRMMISCLTD